MTATRTLMAIAVALGCSASACTLAPRTGITVVTDSQAPLVFTGYVPQSNARIGVQFEGAFTGEFQTVADAFGNRPDSYRSLRRELVPLGNRGDASAAVANAVLGAVHN